MKKTRILIVLIGVLYNFLVTLGPLLLYGLINDINNPSAYLYLICYGCVLILQVVVGYFDMKLLWFNEKNTKFYYNDLINQKYMKIDFKNNENFDINSVVALTNNVVDIHEYIENKLMFIRYLIALVMYSSCLFLFINYYLFILVAVMLFIYLLSSIPNKLLYKTRSKYLKARETFMNYIRTLFNNHFFFKGYAKPKIVDIFENESIQEQAYSYKNDNTNRLSQTLNVFYFDCFKLLVIVICILLINNNILAVATSISIYLYSKYIFELFDSIIYTKNNMKNYKSSFIPISNFLKLEELDKGVDDFEIIEFKESKLKTEYLDLNLNFKILKNQKYFIKGDNGVGKSTLLKMLSSSIKLECDNIYIDNCDYKSVNTTNLISYMSKDPLIFNSNFSDNVSVFGKSNYTFSFNNYPNIIKKIEEVHNINDASILSAGEKQFIVFLRSCLSDSKILIYDEAFSKINADLVKEIMSYLSYCDKTVIVVEHNFNFNIDNFRTILFEGDMVYEQTN